MHHRRHAHESPQVAAAADVVEGATTIPTSSPWGAVQHADTLGPGITSVSTASHGGIHLDAWRVAQLPPALQTKRGQWFEEDVDWCIPAVAFPQHFDRDRQTAIDTLRNWLPDLYEAHFNEVLPVGASMRKDERTFYARHANDLVVTSAFGSAHARELLPDIAIADRQVMVIARTNVGVPGAPLVPGKEAVFLVDGERYDRRDGPSYVIDPQVDTALGDGVLARLRGR